MLNNTEERQIRIMNRARSYANGTISLQDFFDQEKAEDDDVREKERKKLAEMLKEAKRERAKRERAQSERIPDTQSTGLDITKEDFNKLPLFEQSKLFEDHPDEIRKLLEPVVDSKITLEQFRELSLEDQNKYFLEDPDQVKALRAGTVSFVNRKEWSK